MLKEYRLNHNLKQEEMAKLLNVSNTSYSLYENRKRNMNYDILIKFLTIRNEKNDKELIELLNEVKKRI